MHVGRKALEEDHLSSVMYHRVSVYEHGSSTPRMAVRTLCVGSC